MIQANPLGFYCPPNGCTPDYATCHNVQAFIGYGFIVSHMSRDDISEKLAISDEDTVWLREGFLRCVEIAADMVAKVPKPKEREWIDMGSHGTGITLYPTGYDRDAHLDEDPPGNSLNIEWVFDFRDSDGTICITQRAWGEDGRPEDDHVLWLDSRCLNNRFRLAKAIAKARVINGLQCVISPLERRLVT